MGVFAGEVFAEDVIENKAGCEDLPVIGPESYLAENERVSLTRGKFIKKGRKMTAFLKML